ncbi:MAG: hypothetical protein IJE43_15075 [Alphaproteobacteria bacterium]|nr:hypothetical protein [Alphaproteobacteria bacterium]
MDKEQKELELSNKIRDEIYGPQELSSLIREIRDADLDPDDTVGLITAAAFHAAKNVTFDTTDGISLWRAIRYITGIQMPMRMIDFTAILKPGMEKYFANILTPTAFDVIRTQAEKMLENEAYENKEEKEHLIKISKGEMPYGYSLEMPSKEEFKNEEK